MNSFFKKACCSLLLAAIVIGAMAWAVSSLFDGGSIVDDGVQFPAANPAKPDENTVVMDMPSNIIDGTHTEPSVDYDGSDGNAKFPFGGNGTTASKPVVSVTPDTNTNVSTPPVGGETNGGGSTTTTPDQNTKPPVTTTPTVPNTQLSNIASVIKGRTYTSGLDIFQSSKNDISTDTSALMAAIKKGYNNCSFIAIRLSDGACIAYNANALYNCASSYKTLASLYAFEQADAGVYNLDSTLLTYTAADYYPGSGVIKTSAIGSVYTLRQIADYSIRYSDNVAYTMLQRYIDKSGLTAFAKKLGCPNYESFSETNWPRVSAVDAALWWAEIYNYSKRSTNGSKLYNIFLNATHTSIKTALGNEHAVAHKSGSTSYYYHDTGIVHSEDPYIIAVYTHNPTNYTSDNQAYFAPVVREIDKLINP